MIIWLAGYRGTGKTTVGAILAERLAFACLDSDDEIERRSGKTIARIFAEDGEERFRDLEAAVLLDALQRDNQVVTLGGGALVRAANRELVKRRGVVVWLRASAETIHQRLRADPNSPTRRPRLTPEGGLSEIRQVLQERSSSYAECASFRIDTDHMTPHEIAEHIRHLLDQEAP
jgi:shikimate kinase